jgi:hypothetical protein
MLAVANPSPEENHDNLTTRAAGFGIVKFNKKTRKITIECWPRNVDITDASNKQYPGWPRTIDQLDNYARQPVAYLPTLHVSGMTDPVIQIVDEETGAVVYTLRIGGKEFRPMVFKQGPHTVRVGEPGTARFTVLTSIEPLKSGEERTLAVSF